MTIVSLNQLIVSTGHLVKSCDIRLESPEDRHLRNFNTSGPDPLGFDWEGLVASRGKAGGQSGRPLI